MKFFFFCQSDGRSWGFVSCFLFFAPVSSQEESGITSDVGSIPEIQLFSLRASVHRNRLLCLCTGRLSKNKEQQLVAGDASDRARIVLQVVLENLTVKIWSGFISFLHHSAAHILWGASFIDSRTFKTDLDKYHLVEKYVNKLVLNLKLLVSLKYQNDSFIIWKGIIFFSSVHSSMIFLWCLLFSFDFTGNEHIFMCSSGTFTDVNSF